MLLCYTGKTVPEEYWIPYLAMALTLMQQPAYNKFEHVKFCLAASEIIYIYSKENGLT